MSAIRMDLRKFLVELKRRNVYRVAAAYVVVGWLLVQVATQVFPFFEVPNWGVRLIVLGILIGLPVALLLAWAYEITPEGVKRTEDVAPGASRPRRTGRKLDFLIITVLAAVIALLIFDRFRTPRSAPDTASEKSIAVLPFANLSEDKSNAYFADGIQDEILTRLSKIGAMKVISRTSTQQFQSRPGSVTDIAKQLAVAHILEGSVQKSGDAVRVNVQLIKADHDSHVWAETYDRKLTDIFAVESEIAEKIASALAAHLTGRERDAIATVPTQNQEAYDNYLRALDLLNSQDFRQLLQGRDALKRAVELDPGYAQAWARLALAEAEIYFGAGPGEGIHTAAQAAQSRRAAETAIRLAPELSDSHLGLGSYYYYCEQDFDRALAELREAHRLAPNDSYIIFATGLVKRRLGKLEEALKLQREAVVLDPRNSDMWVNLARTYGALRDFTQVQEMFDRAITIARDEPDIVTQKAFAYLIEGKPDAAEAVIASADTGPAASAFGVRVNLHVLRREFDRAVELLQTSVNTTEVPARNRTSDRLQLGALQLWFTHDPAGRANVEQARAELTAYRTAGDTSPEHAVGLIMAGALLGDRDAVEREGETLLQQARGDHWQLPRARVAIARGYAVLGDADRAVKYLAEALAAPDDVTPTPALLRLDPVWDKIR
ncbi:MAG: hypothetical protein ABI540_11530, partial [Spartobacteria bacterium]